MKRKQRRNHNRRLPLPARMVAIVAEHGPLSPRDLQRRCGLPKGNEGIRILIGPRLDGFSVQFCEVFCPLVWRGVLRIEQRGWNKRTCRVMLGHVKLNALIA